MTLRKILPGIAGLTLMLTGCVSSVAYDPVDYDFRYGIYDDYWGGSDVDRPDRPRPPNNLRPSHPIHYPPGTRPPGISRPGGGHIGAAGGLRGGGGGFGGGGFGGGGGGFGGGGGGRR